VKFVFGFSRSRAANERLDHPGRSVKLEATKTSIRNPRAYRGRLADQDVFRIVERLRRLGDVHEVEFHEGSLNGLRLFYTLHGAE
jgi:hypothetical protein